MIRFIVALLLAQALYCAEFPDLENHINITWSNKNVTQIDGSQTVSDKNGKVSSFILCGAYNNAADNGFCSYTYSYAEQSSGSIFSGSGSGQTVASFVSKVNETYSCLLFLNPVGDFKGVYDATLVGKGGWKVSYSCDKYVPDKGYAGLIVAVVIIGIVLVVGYVFGVPYLKKRKSQKEGETDGQSFLQNA